MMNVTNVIKAVTCQKNYSKLTATSKQKSHTRLQNAKTEHFYGFHRTSVKPFPLLRAIIPMIFVIILNTSLPR